MFERLLLHLALDFYSATQDVPPETPVAHQAEYRILERRGMVVLKEEVADPGECVSLEERHRNQPPGSRHRGDDEQRNGDASTSEMQPSAGAVGMFAQIKRIEIPESMKRVFIVHRDSPRWYEGPRKPDNRTRVAGRQVNRD